MILKGKACRQKCRYPLVTGRPLWQVKEEENNGFKRHLEETPECLSHRLSSMVPVLLVMAPMGQFYKDNDFLGYELDKA